MDVWKRFRALDGRSFTVVIVVVDGGAGVVLVLPTSKCGWAAEMDEWMEWAALERRDDRDDGAGAVVGIGLLGSKEEEGTALSWVTMDCCNISSDWPSTEGFALYTTSSQLF
jgi:hypothetical protein